MMYFVENYGGMIQADGEGFYEGSTVIVPIPCRTDRDGIAVARWLASDAYVPARP